MNRKKIRFGSILLLALAAAALLATGVTTFSWFALARDTVYVDQLRGNAHAAYFNGGNGTAPAEGTTKDDYKEPGTAYPSYEHDNGNSQGPYQIDNAIQLYNFAWLQYLGYFNRDAEEGGEEDGVLNQTYFVLTSDIDLSTGDYAGLTLPPVGNASNPFLGNFNGNGYTIKGLTASNVKNELENENTPGTASTAVNVPSSALSGSNLKDPAEIVGFFGVIGETDDTSGTITVDGRTLTYDSSVISVTNVVIEDAIIKTQTANSLAGVAAGYVNGTMADVKVVGGSITSNATQPVGGIDTTNLSDYGAVGYCTEPFRGTNNITTVIVYDPQAMTSNGGGAADGQGNNWGGSVEMKTMYEDLRQIYTTTTNTSNTYASAITITHHADGTVTEEVMANGTGNLSVSVGGTTYPIKVTEVDDNGDVIASYAIVQRNDSADFVYLYGEKVVSTLPAAITDVYEKNAVYIYSESTDYLTFNNGAFSNSTSTANATKWVVEDGVIYTIDGSNKIYLIKSATNELSTVTAAVSAAVPATATVWTIEDTAIYAEDWYLCYKNGVWKLMLRDRLLITDDYEAGSEHYLTLVNGNYAGTMVREDAISWTKEMVSTDPEETQFYLYATVGSDNYYLKEYNGTLQLELNPATPSTKWKYKAATETEKSKVYTLINDDGDGYALYYDDAEDVQNWALTDFSEMAAGSGQGDSFGDSINMRTIYNRLSTAWDQAAASSIRYISSETVYIDKNGEELTDRRETNYSTKTAPFITTTDDVGSYSFARYQSGDLTNKRFLYLYGDDTIALTKTVTTITYSDQPAYYISDEGHYLTCSTNAINNNITAAGNATKWVLSSGVTGGAGGTISTQINGTTYYLRNNNGTLSVGTTADNTWKLADQTITSGNYRLTYDGSWKLTDVTYYFLITDGNGNYLNANGTTISRGTNATTAMHWYVDGTNRIYNDAGYYLRNNNGNLSATNSTYYASTWTIEENQIRSESYYLYNNNGTWALKNLTTTYIISDGNGNYLYRNGANLQNTTNASQATRWTFSDGDAGGYISNGGYYLRNNGGTLTTTQNTNNRTNWSIDGSRIYNGNYSLYYNGTTWALTTNMSGYTLGDASGHYISNSGTTYTITNSNAAGATRWVINADGAYANTVNLERRLMWFGTGNTFVAPSNDATSTTAYYHLDVQNRLVANTPSNGTYYVRYNNGWTTTTNENQATTIVATYYDAGTDLTITSHADNTTEVLMDRVDLDLTVGSEDTVLEWQDQAVTTEPSYYTTNPTYFPLSIDDDGTIHKRNTGYIVSGSELGNPGTEAYGYNGKGDIRVSYYPISSGQSNNISGAVTNGQLVTTKIRTIDGSGDKLLTNAYVAANFHKYSDDGTTEGSFTKMNAVLSGQSYVYGLHFMNAAISEDNLITIENAKVNGKTHESYELPRDSIDFTLKERGYINFFAGTYFNGNNSFFSLHKIERNDDGTIASIKEILEIYGNGNQPYYYKLRDKNGTITYESWEYYPSGTVKSHTSRSSGEGVPGGYSSLFNTDWIKTQSSLTTNTVYYFEIPVDQGEYALGSVDGGTGAYLMYLDIGAAGTALRPEGNAKLVEAEFDDLEAKHSDAGIVSYTLNGGTRNSDLKTLPTYYPLAWNEGHTAVANTNTGYVISGANTNSNPPGDIRVSQYTKYAQGAWSSIRNSLTSANNAGILNNARVYTIIDGTEQTITAYGIGNQHTMQYARVSEEMNALLRNQQYVYGLHFMQATISADNTVTVPKAVINGNTYTDYVMPQDSIDFNVATKGKVTFLAGTYFSGSNGTQSFFSLHQVIRDANQNITAIKELSEIFGDGGKNSKFIYRYIGDPAYYYSDGTVAGASLPTGYNKLFDTTVLRSNQTLRQNSVYYFEVPLDPGEFALGSAEGDGAYLIYLDIAANKDFDIKTTITEVTEQYIHTLNYPKGVAFADSASSTAFDTDGHVDPEKSVFTTIPMDTSNGTTTFAMTSDGALTVTNSTSSLEGFEAKCIPLEGSLTVNGTTVTISGKHVVIEKVTEIDTDSTGTTTTTVTVTTQTTENGETTTTVTQTVTTSVAGGEETTETTDPAPEYDGHELIPLDNTLDTETTASTILEYTIRGAGLENEVARDGNLNYTTTDKTVTRTEIVNGAEKEVTYTVIDVVKPEGGEDTGSAETAATYIVTVTGTAGTYDADVTEVNTDFTFTMNDTAITAVQQYSITVTE